jgi:hypothetical protein
MMLHAFLLATTASAMGLVAHVTGSWGAGFWAMVLGPLSALACLYDAHTRHNAGGDPA